jgi:SAM-dependent methyltransferase
MDTKVDTTDEWVKHYQDPIESKRRKLVLESKLEKLGVFLLDKQANILDLCCGNLEVMEILHERGYTSVVGVDQTLFHPEDTRFPVFKCDATKLPFEDMSFDAVINVHAMHHLGDLDDLVVVLDEIHRILRAGGELFILDFAPSIKLKIIFFLLKKKLLYFTRYMRHYADQLILEEDIIDRYLLNYKQFISLMDFFFRKKTVKYDAWHIYLCLERLSN